MVYLTSVLFITMLFKGHFKTHTLLELYEDKRRPRQVVMLEHKSGYVLAINQDDDTVIAKV